MNNCLTLLWYTKKGPFGPVFIFRNKASLASEASNAHVSRAPAGSSNAREGSVGQIKDATTVVRAVVCDFDHDTAAIALVGHSHLRAEWQASMGGSEAVSIEAFTTGRTLSVKAISHAVPTAGAAGRIGFGLLRRKRDEQ